MSDDLVVPANAPDGPGAMSDYAATVVTEQIESLRRIADELDRRYASRIKNGRLKPKDGMAYLAVRERVASRIVDFATELCQLRATEAPTNPPGGEPSGALSWNPDDDGPAALSPAAQ